MYTYSSLSSSTFFPRPTYQWNAASAIIKAYCPETNLSYGGILAEELGAIILGAWLKFAWTHLTLAYLWFMNIYRSVKIIMQMQFLLLSVQKVWLGVPTCMRKHQHAVQYSVSLQSNIDGRNASSLFRCLPSSISISPSHHWRWVIKSECVGVWDLGGCGRSCNLLLRRHLVLSPVYNIIKVVPLGAPSFVNNLGVRWSAWLRQEALTYWVCKPCDDLREHLCIRHAR